VSALHYLYVATLAILCIEIVAGRHRGIYNLREFGVLGGCVLLGAGVIRPVLAIIQATLLGWLLPRYQGAWSGIPFIWATLGLLLITELSFYWTHRLAHEGRSRPALRWLWKLHRTHHSGKYMNVVTTVRVNPFWNIVVPTSWILGTAAYLGQGAAAAVVLSVIYGWNLITHAHFRWDDGLRASPRVGRVFRAIEQWLVSPGVHHTHHGYGRDGATYRNYAVTLSCIDRFFGTLRVPQGRPAHYGLPGLHEPFGEAVLYPLVQIDRSKTTAEAEPATVA